MKQDQYVTKKLPKYLFGFQNMDNPNKKNICLINFMVIFHNQHETCVDVCKGQGRCQ